jgi:hypothetical protein
LDARKSLATTCPSVPWKHDIVETAWNCAIGSGSCEFDLKLSFFVVRPTGALEDHNNRVDVLATQECASHRRRKEACKGCWGNSRRERSEPLRARAARRNHVVRRPRIARVR